MISRSAFDIANYFISKVDGEAGEVITPLKLQKLLYYAQAWSLAFHEKPIFREKIEAWKHGPVVPDVYHHYKKYRYEPIPLETSLVVQFSPEENAVLEEVWAVYGELGAKALEKLTHAEYPWKKARQGYEEDEKSNELISLDYMRDYYIMFVEEI